MERIGRVQLSEDDLYSMPLQDLSQLSGKLEAKRCEGVRYASNARKRTPYEDRVIDIWFDRSRLQLIEENRTEYHKKLQGEPNDFDPYAPF